MKISKNSLFTSFIISFSLAILLTGCVGSVGVDPSEDPVQPSENEEAAEEGNEEGVGENEVAANEEENTGNGNFNNSENAGNGNGGNANFGNNTGNGGNQGDGEGLNNAAEEEFANNAEGGNLGNGGGNNLFGSNNKGSGNNLGQGNNNNLGLNQGEDALVNNAETDLEPAPDVNQGATDLAVSNGAEESLAPTSRNEATVSGSGRVRYVMAGGTKMYEKPQGQVIKSLEQGDHPLVSEEGEWARTSDGFYIPSGSLTAQPVGRNKIPQNWQ